MLSRCSIGLTNLKPWLLLKTYFNLIWSGHETENEAENVMVSIITKGVRTRILSLIIYLSSFDPCVLFCCLVFCSVSSSTDVHN